MFKRVITFVLALSIILSMFYVPVVSSADVILPEGDFYTLVADDAETFEAGDKVEIVVTVTGVPETTMFVAMDMSFAYNAYALEPVKDEFTSNCDEINASTPQEDIWEMYSRVESSTSEIVLGFVEDGYAMEGSNTNGLKITLVFTALRGSVEGENLIWSTCCEALDAESFDDVYGNGVLVKAKASALFPNPTAAPTATPTAAPTATPTAAPTATPTAAPTAAPTATPTAAPTAAPTASPVPTPLYEPVFADKLNSEHEEFNKLKFFSVDYRTGLYEDRITKNSPIFPQVPTKYDEYGNGVFVEDVVYVNDETLQSRVAHFDGTYSVGYPIDHSKLVKDFTVEAYIMLGQGQSRWSLICGTTWMQGQIAVNGFGLCTSKLFLDGIDSEMFNDDLNNKSNYIGHPQKYLYSWNIGNGADGCINYGFPGDGKSASMSAARDTWVHMVYTHDGNTEQLYVDGVKIIDQEARIPEIMHDTSSEMSKLFRIGGYNWANNWDLDDGYIAYINCYETAASPSVVKDLYDSRNYVIEVNDEAQKSKILEGELKEISGKSNNTFLFTPEKDGYYAYYTPEMYYDGYSARITDLNGKTLASRYEFSNGFEFIVYLKAGQTYEIYAGGDFWYNSGYNICIKNVYDYYSNLKLDVPNTANIPYQGYKDFIFVPEYSGEYVFYSQSTLDTIGYLYDVNFNQLSYDDDSGDNTNFKITYNLEAGQVYIYRAKFYSEYRTGSFDVYLNKVGFKYKSYGTYCEITGYVGDTTNLTIPSEIDGLPVEGIGAAAFCYDENLYSIEIPESLKYISQNAFYDCYNLFKVYYDGNYQQWTELDIFYIGNTYLMDSDVLFLDDSEFLYTIKNDCCVIKGYNGNQSEIFIPSEIEGYPVTSIDNNVFQRNSNLIKIHFGKNVSHIGDYAFSGCSSLTEVVIPESVTFMGINVFSGCCNLEYIELPSTIETIGYGFFSGCSSLKFISIPDSVKTIGQNAFSNCTGLTSVDIPDSVTSIRYNAFWGCSGMYGIQLSENLTDIGEGVFYGCTSLKKIKIPASLLRISDKAFQRCSSLNEISLPETLKSIGDYAFSGCSSLIETVIPSGVSYIGECAFAGCTSLMKVTLPDYISEIRYQTFTGCISLTDIVIPDSVTTIGQNAFANCESIESISISGKVTNIRYYAFSGCSALKEIIISSYVNDIGEGAFNGCRALESVYYNSAVEKWNKINIEKKNECLLRANIIFPSECSDFEYIINGSECYITGYKGLETELIIPSLIGDFKVTGISGDAFYNNLYLKKIVIPSTITNINDSAFYGCSSLENIVVVPENEVYSSSGNCLIETKTGTIKLGCNTSVIPNDGSIKYIGNEAFYNCQKFEYITIPEGVLGIGNGAFRSCKNLKGVELPNTILYVGAYAFSGCSSITNIDFPDSVIEIGDNAFSGCKNLTFVKLPIGIDEIKYYTFSGCTKLSNINIPDGVKSIGYGAFSNCSSLTSIILPDTLTEIRYYAFTGCNGLRYIIMNDNVNDIGRSAFAGCNNLYDVYYIGTESQWDSIYISYNGNDQIKYYAQIHFVDSLFSKPEDFDYTIYDGYCNISGYAGDSLFIEIPKEFAGLSVTGIEEGAFENCYILGAILPNTVKTIGKNAFKGSALTNIVLSDGLEVIDEGAFSDCFNLTNIVIPDSVTLIGENSFSFCSALKDVKLSKHLVIIGSGAFSSCLSLKNIELPDYLKILSDNVFYNCKNLTDITIPASVKSIGDQIFSGCSSLESINVDSGNKKYHSAGNCLIETKSGTLLYGCKNSIIPSDGSIKSIYDYAFAGLDSISYMEMPDSITSVGSYAFAGCTGLKDIKLSSNLKNISSNMFDGCIMLVEVTIPSSVETIGESAFAGCKSLEKVIISDNVSTIGSNAFDGCNVLTDITLPSKLTYISSALFYNCSSLESVEIPEYVTGIGSSAFYGCTSLEGVKIPFSVKHIDSNAFGNCVSLDTVTYVGTEELFESINVDNYGNVLFEIADKVYLNGTLPTPKPEISVPTGGDYKVKSEPVFEFKAGDTVKIKLNIADIADGVNVLGYDLEMLFNSEILRPELDLWSSSCDEINANNPGASWKLLAVMREADTDSPYIAITLLDDGKEFIGMTNSDNLWIEAVFTALEDGNAGDLLAWLRLADGTSNSGNFEVIKGSGTKVSCLAEPEEVIFKDRTNFNEYINSLGDDIEYTVYKNGVESNANEYLGTGMMLAITDNTTGESYTVDVVVYGDINGDGRVATADYMAIKNAILNKDSLSGSLFTAADVNKDGRLTAVDYMKVNAYFKGAYDLYGDI